MPCRLACAARQGGGSGDLVLQTHLRRMELGVRHRLPVLRCVDHQADFIILDHSTMCGRPSVTLLTRRTVDRPAAITLAVPLVARLRKPNQSSARATSTNSGLVVFTHHLIRRQRQWGQSVSTSADHGLGKGFGELSPTP